MSNLDYRRTNMDKETYNYLESKQQYDKYNALNTYKVKLCSTHADNYIEDNIAQTPGTATKAGTGQNPSGGLRWSLPAIPGNHINNCLIKVVGVSIPACSYAYDIQFVSDGYYQLKYKDTDHPNTQFDVLYVKSNNAMRKTFISQEKSIFPAPILGSLNVSYLYKHAHIGNDEGAKDTFISNVPISDGTNMIDNDYILCANPFGGNIHLELVLPETLGNKEIRCSLDGERATTLADGATENTLLNVPVIYELEIKLLPDNQSNDKFSY